jgi:hypothetical protein
VGARLSCALHDDVIALAEDDRAAVDKLGATLADAVQRDAAAIDAHNAKLAPMTRRAVELGLNGRRAPGEPQPLVAMPEYGHGSLFAGAARVGPRDSRRDVERVVADALSAHAGELSCARRAVEEAAAPPVRMRRFRPAVDNGVVIERPADRPIGEALQRQLDRGELVEITGGVV